MRRKNLKILRQNRHQPERKACDLRDVGRNYRELQALLPSYAWVRVKRTEVRRDRLSPTLLHSPSGAGED